MRVLAFAITFTFCAAVAYFSYNVLCLTLDPYNVVWQSKVRARAAWAVEQFRTAKVRQLAAHPDRHDGLILSDSRGAISETAKVNRATSRHLFNLSTSGDTPIGFLPKARWAMATQSRLRDVVLILAPTQFQNQPDKELLLFHEHPDVGGEGWLPFYWTFSNLPLATFQTSARYYVRRMLGRAVDRTPLVNSGFDAEIGDTNIWPRSDFEQTEQGRAKFDVDRSRDPPGLLRFHNSFLDASLEKSIAERNALPLLRNQSEAFAELIDLLKSKSIEVVCVISPLPVANLRLIPADLYFEWMHIVVRHCGIAWDFSTPSAITADNYNYWDIDHFLPGVSERMLRKALGGDDPGFGTLVSVENFDVHRKDWQAALRNF